MKLAYRTLKIKRPLSQLDPAERQALVDVVHKAERMGLYFAKLLLLMGREKATQHLDAYVRLTGNGNLKYFAKNYKYFAPEIMKMYKQMRIKKALFKVRVPFTVQVRTKDERDRSSDIFIDLRQGVLRIRRIIQRRAIVVPLTREELRYIQKRIKENARAVYAQIWIDDKYLYVAITFRREVEPLKSRGVLAVDVNSLAYGVVYMVVVDGKVELKKIKPPKVTHSLSKMGRRAKDYVNKSIKEIVQDALMYSCEIWVDTPRRSSIDELLKNGLPPQRKVILYGVRRLVKKLVQTAQWYGVPVKFVRLPSSLCPQCGEELEHHTIDGGRMVYCRHCGFAASRDVVPLLWAIRRLNGGASHLFSS